MGFGRIFSIKERYRIQIRAEFVNVFNRLFYSTPQDGAGFLVNTGSVATPTAHANSLNGVGGLLSAGYGYVNWVGGAGALPRSGQLIAKFEVYSPLSGRVRFRLPASLQSGVVV
jgi:hypothetical protein